MSAQPSPEAVELVANVGRTNGVLAIAVWQEIDFATEQRIADDAEEALFRYITRLEQDAARYRFLRDNPLQLRAIDGNAGWTGQMTTEQFDAHTDIANAGALA